MTASLALWLTALTAPITWSWRDGWPAGWTAAPDASWQVVEGELRVQGDADGAVMSTSLGRLAEQAEITFDLRTPSESGLPGLLFGLSDGAPNLPTRRAVQLTVRPGGRLAWFDGQSWREVGSVPAGARLSVVLRLDSSRGQYRLAVQHDGREPLAAGPLPFWNQVGFPDTVYVANGPVEALGHDAGAVRAVSYDPAPPLPRAPRLDLSRAGPATVRLRWSAVPGAGGYRVRRDGQVIAELRPSEQAWLDTTVSPQTRYAYEVEAIGHGTSRPAALVTGPQNELAQLQPRRFDALVYGATPGGIAAAITLGKRGRKVLLVAPDDNIGGMMTGGLSRTDFGSIHALGGLFKRFIGESYRHYADTYGPDSANAKVCRDGLYFEPQVARRIFLRWLAEVPNLTLVRQTHLVGVSVLDRAVQAVVLEDRRRSIRVTLRAGVFIDASYEGDLAAYAGASYLIGREAGSEFHEQYAGKLWWDVWERRIVRVEGSGDRIVQAYCYRLCLTKDVENRLPPPRPERYDRRNYVGLLPDIRNGRLDSLKQILSILELPNRKADANNHPQGNPSSDLIGGADAYPEATWAEREVIAAAHRDHILGLLWFLRFDPEVPEALRRDAQQWGLARDEFPETDSWPAELYVREGRRILGDVIFTEHGAMAVEGGERPPVQRDSIAVGAYPIDSHATGGRDPHNPDLLEGFFYLARGETKPYQIPYHVMLPRGIRRLAVCGCVSSTHVGYGTLRMEPVFMGLGLAAGLAADQALGRGGDFRAISLDRLQVDLLAHDQVLTVFEDVNHETPGYDGFNFWGTLGAFPGYRAGPDEPLTGDVLADWLRRAPWATWRQVAEKVPVGPLGAAEFADILAQLGAGRVALTAPPTRADAMAALWRLARPRLER